MVRMLILGLLVFAAARVVAADETATSTATATDAAATSTTAVAASTTAATAAAASSSTPATSAPVTNESIDATKRAANGHTAVTKAGGKPEPQAAASEGAPPGGDVKMSGMSILGNEDAPKSLVIVPWKSSQLADMPSVSRLLDSATQPVDKDVFMRELAYYEFKSSSK